MKNQYWIIFVLFLMTAFFVTVAWGGDAEQIKAENKTVIGEIIIEHDDSFNAKSVYIFNSNNNEKIWITTLNWLEDPFKTFVVNTNADNKTVGLTGLVEYWTDGIIMRPENITRYERVE